MKLFSVFSDNALFQASSTLTVRGRAEPGISVFAKLEGHNASTHGRAITQNDGIFEVTIDTPSPSYNKYEIIITDGNETVKLKNIIFGELWLASGQSNMELPNNDINENDWYLDKLKDYDIRVYAQYYGPSENFSTMPQYDTEGVWTSTQNVRGMKTISACATGFIKGLYERFQEMGKQDIPVGFLNISWGATSIAGWLPKDKLNSVPRIKEFLDKYDRNFTEENVNDTVNNTLMLIQRPFVMFNRRIAPVFGLKIRGVIWYQGETDLWCAFKERIYHEFLYLYHDVYKELFAANKDNFKIICSLIYPWRYGAKGDTDVGYLNEAFETASREYPDKFICCPCYDLPPSWHSLNNHPIHPMNKYPLGERLSRLALVNVYGDEGQIKPALMKDVRKEDNKLIVTYENEGKSLFTFDGLKVRGMYIAGKDRLYMPADCDIISDNEIAVYHPYLEEPCHCFYGRASVEVNQNLFYGDYPVMPFATDSKSEEPITIELKEFLNVEIQNQLDLFDDGSPNPDWYLRPIWKALDGSEVCLDNAFVMASCGLKTSIGVGSSKNPFGMYATSQPYHCFDFQNYESLEVDVYACGKLDFSVILTYEDGSGTKISAIPSTEKCCEFLHYTIPFDNIKDERITKMAFVFNIDNHRIMKHVNVGRLYLKPKNV